MNSYLNNIFTELKATPYYEMMTHIDVPIICGFIGGSHFDGTADEKSDIDIEFITIGQTNYPGHSLGLTYNNTVLHWNYIALNSGSSDNPNMNRSLYGWGLFLNSFPDRLYIYQNQLYESGLDDINAIQLKYRNFMIYLAINQQQTNITNYLNNTSTDRFNSKKIYGWVYLYEYLNNIEHNYNLLCRIKRLQYQTYTSSEVQYIATSISYLQQWYKDNPYDINTTTIAFNHEMQALIDSHKE